MLTLIGGRAVRHSFNYAWDDPKTDRDYHSPVEFAGEHPIREDRLDIFVDPHLGAWDWGPIATPDELYTMKISHSFWEINAPESWDRHASDIVFLERKGAVFIRELYDILLPIWKERYKRNPTNLEQNASMFFADAVDRKYDHDSLHASVAYFDSPLFERILRDGSDVAVDNAKFWAMDFDTKIKLVRELIYATALERIVIPRDYKVSPRWAYHWAVRRTATSLFKGEWALFLMKNLDLLMKPDIQHVQRHLDQADRLILLNKKETAA